MTDQELGELDGWIADHLFNGERIPICITDRHCLDDSQGPDERGHAWCYDCAEVVGQAKKVARHFTTDPAAFALVKREIERRGWGWRCECDLNSSLKYQFDVFIPKGHPGEQMEPLSEWGETEETAGCLAVKAAIEAK